MVNNLKILKQIEKKPRVQNRPSPIKTKGFSYNSGAFFAEETNSIDSSPICMDEDFDYIFGDMLDDEQQNFSMEKKQTPVHKMGQNFSLIANVDDQDYVGKQK